MQAIYIGILGNILLSSIKFAGGVWGNSSALVADAVHSLSDLLSDAIAWFTYRMGRLPSDENHPYGHGRFETAGSALIGAVIAFAGFGLLFELQETLRSNSKAILEFWVLVPVLFSILINEGLFRYSRALGEKLHSPSLIANAWHHRSDAVSSIAALIGIAGALAGWPVLDPLAGGAVALMIIWTGFKIILDSGRDLMDEGLDKNQIEQIENVIRESDGVSGFHQLRSRKAGGRSFIDVNILVAKDLSVSEGHHIAESLRRNLFKSFPFIEDALIHVDVEDDDNFESIYTCSREELERAVESVLKAEPAILSFNKLRLHYWKGKNTVEVYVKAAPDKAVEEITEILKGVRNKLLDLESVQDAKIYVVPELDGK